MGQAALTAAPELAKITLRMPNRHYLLFDLGRFGIENANAVFYPTDEPHRADRGDGGTGVMIPAGSDPAQVISSVNR